MSFLLSISKLGTHGSPRRRSAGHDPPVKHLGLGEVKRFTGGMHNTENLSGMSILRIKMYSFQKNGEKTYSESWGYWFKWHNFI